MSIAVTNSEHSASGASYSHTRTKFDRLPNPSIKTSPERGGRSAVGICADYKALYCARRTSSSSPEVGDDDLAFPIVVDSYVVLIKECMPGKDRQP